MNFENFNRKSIWISKVTFIGIFRWFIALMMEAVSTSETPVFSTRLHGATPQKVLNLSALDVV
jgi:hypothetical protein